MRRWIGAVAALVIGLGMAVPATAQRVAGKDASFVVQAGTGTKVFEMGPKFGKVPPANWATTTFDDSGWQSAERAVPQHQDSGAFSFGWSFPNHDGYWGQYSDYYYLFRQTFLLPPATSYRGTLSFRTFIARYKDTGYLHILFNGATLPYSRGINTSRKVFSISPFLKAGSNVLAIYAGPTILGSGVGFRLDLQARDITGPVITPTVTPTVQPVASTPAVSVTVPADGAVVTQGMVPFQWQAFPGAARYYLQFWLVKPAAGGGTINDAVRTNVTATFTGTLATFSTLDMRPGTYQWRMAAVAADGTLLSGWTEPRNLVVQ